MSAVIFPNSVIGHSSETNSRFHWHVHDLGKIKGDSFGTAYGYMSSVFFPDPLVLHRPLYLVAQSIFGRLPRWLEGHCIDFLPPSLQSRVRVQPIQG